MRSFARLLVPLALYALTLGAIGALAQSVEVRVPSWAPGAIPGTSTNDNAPAGGVGQLLIASSGETGLIDGTTTVTITIATPGVVTWGTTIPFSTGTNCAAVNFTTTTTLPTGITAGTQYYVIGSSISGNTFQIATSCANAIAGTAVATSGSQAGTHTGIPTLILSTGTAADWGAIQLTPGDWDVDTDLAFVPTSTTSITNLASGSSTASATQQKAPGQYTNWETVANVPVLTTGEIFHSGPRRYSVSVNTTIFAVMTGTFTASTLRGWGAIRARRVR